ncbi:MAG: DUF4153 domain-containing protein [Deltaproteobacteria bacterium]
MNRALQSPSAPASPGAAATTAAPRVSRSTARSILGTALLLGIAGDALLRDFPVGFAFGVWIATLSLAAVSLLWRAEQPVSRETGAWLVAAVFFALGFAWRNSDELLALDFLATIGALGMAAVSSSNAGAALFARRLRDTLIAGFTVVKGVLVGMLPLVFRESLAGGEAKRIGGRFVPLVRAAAISGALLLVFGALLRGADPIFASLVTLPSVDVDVIMSHVLLIGFFTWVVGGWSRAAVIARTDSHASALDLPFRFGMLDITAALGTLNVLFAAFVLAQLGWFFGGERFLQERTGLTAATYARQGFFQLVWVVTLVVPVLVATRATLEPGRALARRHTALSLPIIGLLGVIIVSATLRMKMYVHFYGLTTDRLYAFVFMAWLAVVLIWLALTVLRDWGRPFVAGATISGLAVLALLNGSDPDAFVARVNIERGARMASTTQPSLDLAHLSQLRGHAVALATQATLANPIGSDGSTLRAADDAQRCIAARTLLNRWGPSSRASLRQSSDAAWRFWNAADAAATRTVATHFNALLQVQHAACKPPAQTVR